MSSPLKQNTTTIQNLLNKINSLPEAGSGSIELPELTNEGSASDLLSGKQLIDQDGKVVTGNMPNNGAMTSTMDGINTKSISIPAGYTSGGTVSLDNTIDNEVDIQEDLITQIATALEGKAAGGEQATPVISVSPTNGLITATAGTKSTTHQLAFQAAKTITPSVTSQIAVSSGYYAGGNVIVAGDSNLVAGNIKSGVSIFGVSGTLEIGSDSGSSDGDGVFEQVLNRSFRYVNDSIATAIGSYAFGGCTSLQTLSFPAAKTIGKFAFTHCSQLTTVSFPSVTNIGEGAFSQCRVLYTVDFPVTTYIGTSAFGNCENLKTLSFPAVKTIGSSAFYGCGGLITVSFPKAITIGQSAFAFCDVLSAVNLSAVTTIENGAFYRCQRLKTLSFPAIETIGSSAFYDCWNLTSLYLMNSTICELLNSNAFNTTPIKGNSPSINVYGSIYVPTSLLTSYKAATNWAYFSNRIVGI